MNVAILMAALLAAQEPKPTQQRDLADLSLEELMQLEVTTASRKEQRLMDAAAAVSVIRGEDIRRTGVRSLPEALRMVPGVNVSLIDGNKWAVSIRGFSDRFGNKLQVLIDGRSVYSPVFSGVFWDQQDTLIEDIDRIEVIRGPGGAVWGANAVNGVINVITKKAKDTQGTMVYGGGGKEERAFGGGRYGGAAGPDLHYRAFVKGFYRDEQHDGKDEWQQGRGGFRTDWSASEADSVTVLGEWYAGHSGTSIQQAAPVPFFVTAGNEHYRDEGGHLLLRWDHRFADGSSLSTQVSYSRSEIETSYFGEIRDTGDFDVTHRFTPLEGHDLVWGLGYRITGDDIDSSFTVSLDPENEVDDVVSAFLQDEIALLGPSLKLTLGSRFEHNDYTGFEAQPSGRLAWRPHERHLVWGAVSRAVRTPSRAENDIRLVQAVFPGVTPPVLSPPFFFTEVDVLGSRHMKSEEIMAYEAGYRLQPDDHLSLDIAVFYNEYENLRSTEQGAAGGLPPTFVVNQVFGSKMEGRTYGAEIAATWQAAKGVRIYGAYTALMVNLDPDSDSTDANTEQTERNDAKGQAYLRGSLDVVDNVSIDLIGRYVGPLGNRDVGDVTEADLRVAWRPRPSIELSVVGQNLAHQRHFESNNSGLGETAREIERGAYLMIRLDF